MFYSISIILVGLALLVVGGEVLLRGAVGLAEKVRLTPAIIGLTVVAAGTSVPELAVSALATMEGKTDIAVGNVIGSNIFNGTFILGIAALITPLAITGSLVKLEYPAMLIISVICYLCFQDGVFSREESLVCVLMYVVFTAYMIRLVRANLTKTETKELKEEVSELRPENKTDKSLLAILSLVVVGIVLLGIGADFTVDGAVELASLFGMSERVIGLTIVACGTSLPEVVTSVVSGLRGRDDVAVANVIGSNIFNIAVILGVSGLLNPLTVAEQIRTFDIYWMLGTSLLMFPVMRSGMKVTRGEGVFMLVAFSIYIGWVLVG
jgi:cation:H+ antiporter